MRFFSIPTLTAMKVPRLRKLAQNRKTPLLYIAGHDSKSKGALVLAIMEQQKIHERNKLKVKIPKVSKVKTTKDFKIIMDLEDNP